MVALASLRGGGGEIARDRPRDHSRSPEITRDYPRSPEIARDRPRSVSRLRAPRRPQTAQKSQPALAYHGGEEAQPPVHPSVVLRRRAVGANACAPADRRRGARPHVGRALLPLGRRRPAPRRVAGSPPGAVNGASSRRVAVDRRPTQRWGGCQALLVEPRRRRGGRFRRGTPGLDQPQERQAARREGGRCAREGRERRPPQSQPVLRCPACVGRCVRVRPLLAAL